MKNLTIEARISLNGGKARECEFRIHDGALFWHGAPKKYAQEEHGNFIWKSNACISESTEGDITIDMVRTALEQYMKQFDCTVEIEYYNEPKLVNERRPKSKKTVEPTAEPTVEPTAEPTAEPIVEPTAEPIETTEQTPTEEYIAEEVEISAQEIFNGWLSPEQIRSELTQKYGQFGGDLAATIYNSIMTVVADLEKRFEASQMLTHSVSADEIRAICAEFWAEQKQTAQPTVKQIEVVSPKGIAKIAGAVNEKFEVFCNLVHAGKPLYMYGPAGSGKSYTAKQVADSLQLDYYETSQALFAHELKGYGDGGGNFVPTAFYKAFKNGGLFFLDEVDASAPEALVVLNNAIANGRFDFPVIGNVDAHPDFRVIAAGNTRMTGATLEYTARMAQDTSFKNRFFFAPVTYDRNVFLAITGGDEEIVSFGEDLRRAARNTGISQLFSYRQAKDLATLVECCGGDDAYLFRGSVLQEKEVDDAVNLYEHLANKENRWAKAFAACIEVMKNEEVW